MLSEPLNVLITGATGFVGRALLIDLLKLGHHITAVVRTYDSALPKAVNQLQINDLGEHQFDKNDALSIELTNIDVVVHSAARVHVLDDKDSDPFAAFRKLNVALTNKLARQAAVAGVKRFIFLSSVKVNGETTDGITPFKETDSAKPEDFYGQSKHEAEQGIFEIANGTAMEIVIIRPPLVYGPYVKANFASLIRLMDKSIPLPLGAVDNKRSFVALDNLVSFIALCVDYEKSPKAKNQVFLVSDGEDVSTTQLLQKVAKALGKRSWLLPVPVGLMQGAANLIGKAEVAEKLFGSLQVDSSKVRDLLEWQPVITMDKQLKKTVEAYLHEKSV